ncbi:hypothetical protein M430DRAFT_22377 [Amorphotheca resinae ATCC 22711]|jgi:hypothetical protein|uniref:Uncharacterized protein n=1 Tax=Amorphotheca resinae ATCC 22711 TaxID=857342 RepID=A0A2T3ARK7_AMORE|nr:hypothetical protein M430DRAFT_22377 [Amorphotheca resinae ATCC 22711]PSS09005.1 hypothetical protein M430DRAFT_22377 [Amorphotheca resinae ATCC 22711]
MSQSCVSPCILFIPLSLIQLGDEPTTTSARIRVKSWRMSSATPSHVRIHLRLNPYQMGRNPRHIWIRDNDPASVIMSTEHKSSGAMRRAEECIGTLPHVSRKTLIPKPSPRATYLQPAVSRGNIDTRTLLISSESGQAYGVRSPLGVSQLPTPPAQSHEQLYGSLPNSRPAMGTWCCEYVEQANATHTRKSPQWGLFWWDILFYPGNYMGFCGMVECLRTILTDLAMARTQGS